MHTRTALYTLALLAAFAATGAAQDGAAVHGAVVPGTLPPEIEALTRDPAAAPIDVFLLFEEQPARAASRPIRAAYSERVAEALRPTREALTRIADLLAPRAERARMSVGLQIAAENALLRPDEREARREARAAATELLSQMRAEIMAEAWALVEPLQQPLVDHVTAMDDARVLARVSVLNAVVVRIAPANLPGLLESHPEIATVRLARLRETSMDVSAPAIGADDWATNSVDGSNQKVAIVDTGVDGTHPALSLSGGGSIVTASTVKLENVKNLSGFNDNATSTDDLHSHGTHLAGTVASQDSTYAGVAPGARLLNAKCFYRTSSNGGSGHDADIVLASDWALTNGAAILNLSFGGSGTTNGTSGLTIFYDAVVDVTGASVAVAAGNSGPNASTLGTPADAFNAVTVGSQDDRGSVAMSNDTLAGSSSRGPTADSRRKPDLTAPGVSIKSSSNTWEGSASDWSVKSGTSMATPHIAGAMALLLDHEAAWEPAALKALLLNSTVNTSPVTNSPDSNWGWGATDLSQAYTDRDRVEGGTLTSTGDSFVFYELSSVAVGDRATLCWNRVAGFASSGRSAGAGAAKSLVDLDLILYDADGDQHTSSGSTVDSVEQTTATATLTDAVLKVKRSGAFPSGQVDVDFGLASSSAIEPAEPPQPVIALTSADVVGPGRTTTITATLSNDGEVVALAPRITLTLPAGWSFATGQAETITVEDVAADDSVQGEWEVISGGVAGTHTVSAVATTTSFGERFDAEAVERSLRIDTTPPSADAGTDIALFATSGAGRTITLSGSGSDDSAVAVSFAWDTDGDGAFDDAVGATPSVTFPLGAHVAVLEVMDHGGNTTTDSVSVQVLDNPPTADAGPDRQGVEGTPSFFDATASTDVEGVLAYEWQFGDGSVSSGATAGHVYANNGLYTATLTVRDLAGATDTDTVLVDVANADPRPDGGPNVVTVEGASVTFSGTAADAGAGDALRYRWSFGDGGTATIAAPTHTYRKDGVFSAVFTVTDEDGGVGVDIVRVDVRNLHPVAIAGADLVIDEGDVVSLHGLGSDPGPDDVVTIEWDLGDGTIAAGADVEHRYLRDGTFRATLIVTDDGGAVTTDALRVTARNVPPQIELPEGLVAVIGRTFSLRLEPTDASPSDAAILYVGWRVIDTSLPDGDPLAVLASGVGRDVRWTADRRFDVQLEVEVIDDDEGTQRQAPLLGVAPPVADAVLPIFALDLNRKLEKKLVQALLSAASHVGANAKRGALRKAQRSIRRVLRTLENSGVDDPVLIAALEAIAEDLAAFEPPPFEEFDSSAPLGTTAEMIAAMSRAPFRGKRRAQLLGRLFALHDAQRRGRPEATIATLQRKALSIAHKLPRDEASAWYVSSLLLL